MSFKAPPSYHEAVGSAVQLNEEGEHSLGSRPFHPMYPVYNFNNNLNLSSPTNATTPQNSHAFGFGSSSSIAEQPAGTPGSISESAIIQKY